MKPAHIFQEDTFHKALALERHRAERSRRSFILMLLDLGVYRAEERSRSLISSMSSVVSGLVRQTDVVGWYENGMLLGVIFTDIPDSGPVILETLRAKVIHALTGKLGPEVASKLAVTLHLFPEEGDWKEAGPRIDIRLYPDLSKKRSSGRAAQFIKRVIDVTVSLGLLFLLSPLFVAVALAVRLTSKGPIIFQQDRLGQFGIPFRFLKFRTMYANNNPKIHKEYVERYICRQSASEATSGQTAVYKLTKDPRVTPCGRFLRKTSLDELPQLWNVLLGEMSLVGPRPPLMYEFGFYDVWHRRRVLELKPGVTGLWQVSGRSRMRFDEMVRLDLRYARRWSLWLDFEILLATPRAVLTCEGGY
jgi:lipopolysaccharide/colanic/teichoic acid biosynthesis glycosyltransferase